jgi:hypothetical protein
VLFTPTDIGSGEARIMTCASASDGSGLHQIGGTGQGNGGLDIRGLMNYDFRQLTFP